MHTLLDAALSYAARGWHVFPAPVGTRRSHIAAAKHGGPRWGATCDPDTLRGYWQTYPAANLGIPTGTTSGIWVLDVDTPEGHDKDGPASLAALCATHGSLPVTLRAQSPTGGVHYYWRMPALMPGHTIRTNAGSLGPGLDVRGEGGMVLAPPSRKPDGNLYRWLPGPDQPADAPEWLLQMVVSTLPPAPTRTATPADLAEVAELLTHIKPDAGGYDQWQRVLAAIHDASNGSDDGLSLADAWSEQGEKYRPGEVADKWRSFRAGRSGGATIATIASYARDNGANVAEIAQRHRLARQFTNPGPVLVGAGPVMPMPGQPAPAPAPDVTELILSAIQQDPTTAVQRLAAEIANLPHDQRTTVLNQCRAYGIKRDMQDAVKRILAERAVAAGADTLQSVLSGPLQHFYIVRNEAGQAMAFDARGDMPAQSRAAMRDAWADLPPVPYMDNTGSLRTRPAVDEWWDAPDTPRYDATGYDPIADTSYLDEAGRHIRNTYRPAHHQPPPLVQPAQIEPYLHILRSNFPDPSDQHILLSAFAHMVRAPGQMLRWAPVMQGTPGCGKGNLVEAVTYAHGHHNAAHPSPDTIATDFNGYMSRKTLVVVNEIGNHTKRELSALAEKLKPWLTDDIVSIHAKGKDARDERNRTCWVFTTNHLHCMLASEGERRYAHFISVLQTREAAQAAMPDRWWQDYRAWWASGGAELVRGFLFHYAASASVTAPVTSSTARAVEAGESGPVQLIREAIADGLPGFRGGWVSANAVRALLQAEGAKVPETRFMATTLHQMGYVETHRPRTSPTEAMRFPAAGERTRLYCLPGMGGDVPIAAYDAAQVERAAPAGNGAVVVRMPGV